MIDESSEDFEKKFKSSHSLSDARINHTMTIPANLPLKYQYAEKNESIRINFYYKL